MSTAELRLDDLARQAALPTTTVRLYRTKGLLHPPRLEGRTGWYDESHLTRLRLVARLQGEGHSLAGIADLFDKWEQGRGLDAVIGVESQIETLLGEPHAVVLEAADLMARFPPGAMTPELMQRAARLGLVALTEDGRVRVTDRRFAETGPALATLGVPLDVILDEWEALVVHTDDIASRFLDVFERHLAPANWQADLDADQARALAATLGQLQSAARDVLAAALDASIARHGRERLSQLVEATPADRSSAAIRS